MVCPAAAAKHAQQQIADDRRRQDKRQRQNNVQNAFEDLQQLSDIIGGKDPHEEDHEGRDRGDAQGNREGDTSPLRPPGK